MIKYVDTHSHLYSEEFNEDILLVIQRAKENGLIKILLPNIDSASIEPMFSLCKKDDIFSPMMGLHPTSIDQNYKEELKKIQAHIDDKSIIGIGEIGIDLYWDTTFIKEQIEAFEIQIIWALERDLPIIIHNRKSFDEVFASLMKIKKERRINKFKGIFHSFSGDVNQGRKVVELGFKLGIGGVVTFKNAKIAEIIKDFDLRDILLETDSPYLSPVPYRGKRNESSYIPLIAEKIAEVKETSLEEVGRITTENVFEVFSLYLQPKS